MLCLDFKQSDSPRALRRPFFSSVTGKFFCEEENLGAIKGMLILGDSGRKKRSTAKFSLKFYILMLFLYSVFFENGRLDKFAPYLPFRTIANFGA